MNMKPVISLFGLLLLCAMTANAANGVTPVWTTPCNLGSGSDPVFSLDSRNQVSVSFTGEEHNLQSRLQADGTWTEPAPIASGLPENTILVFDKAGQEWIAQEKDEEIAISKAGHDGAATAREVVVEKQKNVYVQLLHFSIDNQGFFHLLYGRTPEYDCEANNPGADVFYRRFSGKAWEKELLVAKKMSLSRTWQKPGFAVNAQGRVYVCSYNDLYSFDEKNAVVKETCPIADISMPMAIVAQGTDTLHIIYHPYAEKVAYEKNSLSFVTRQNGTWSKPCTIGSQAAERNPAIILTPAQEIFTAWEDPDSNIRVSMRKAEQAQETTWLAAIEPRSGGSVSLTTQATLFGMPTPVKVQFQGSRDCPPHAKGAIGFVFTVAHADKLGGFHFGEFEGPDAPGGDMEIVVKSRNATTTFHIRPQGSYVDILPGGFSFDFSDLTAKKDGDARKIIQSLVHGADSFELIVTDPKETSKKLRAEFPTTGLQDGLNALLQALH